MGLFNRSKPKQAIRFDFMDDGNDRRHQKLKDVGSPYVEGEQDYSRINQIFHIKNQQRQHQIIILVEKIMPLI